MPTTITVPEANCDLLGQMYEFGEPMRCPEMSRWQNPRRFPLAHWARYRIEDAEVLNADPLHRKIFDNGMRSLATLALQLLLEA